MKKSTKIHKKPLSLILVAVVLLLCFTACGKDTGEGKNIIYPIDNDPVYLDPQIAYDKGARDIINNCFEGLVRLGESGEIVPGVAESWTVSDDGKVYTFTLRQDATWYFPKAAAKLVNEENTDGYEESLTADDFVFAFRRSLSKTTHAKDAGCLLIIKNASKVLKGKMSADKLGVTKTNDGKLKITLENPDKDFLKTLTKAICMPCNEKFFELTKGRYGLSLQYIIGNGPFYMGSWNTDTSITIKKNPYYHGENTAVPQSVYFSINNEFSSRAKKLSSGNYDVTPLDYDGYASIKDAKGVSFIESENTVWSLVFNCNDEYMKNINTRLAVLYGFDASLMTMNESMCGKAEMLVAKSTVSDKTANKIKTDVPAYNEKKAEEYWEKALSELSVNAMSITIKCSEKNEKDIRAVLQNLQKAFGVTCDVRVSVLEESQLIKDIESGNYQIAYAPISAPSDDPVDYLSYAAGIAAYSNEEFDSVIKRIRRAGDADKPGGIKNAQEHLINNGVIVPVFSAKSYLAIGDAVQNVYADASHNMVSFHKTYKFK